MTCCFALKAQRCCGVCLTVHVLCLKMLMANCTVCFRFRLSSQTYIHAHMHVCQYVCGLLCRSVHASVCMCRPVRCHLPGVIEMLLAAGMCGDSVHLSTVGHLHLHRLLDVLVPKGCRSVSCAVPLCSVRLCSICHMP